MPPLPGKSSEFEDTPQEDLDDYSENLPDPEIKPPIVLHVVHNKLFYVIIGFISVAFLAFGAWCVISGSYFLF